MLTPSLQKFLTVVPVLDGNLKAAFLSLSNVDDMPPQTKFDPVVRRILCERNRILMTEDANAAVRGAFDAGATEVIVEENHGVIDLCVLRMDLIDPRCEVIRGADLFAATHIHRLLQALLGLPVPRYCHHPLLTDAQGRRLAKRDGAPSLAARRAAGEDGAALAAALRVQIGLAKSGQSPTLPA